MYVKAAKLVPFAVMGERYGAIGDIIKRSSQFHSDARELQPAPLADGKFKLAPVCLGNSTYSLYPVLDITH